MAEFLIDLWIKRTAHLPFSWAEPGRVGPDGCSCVSWVAGYVGLARGVRPMLGFENLRGKRAALAAIEAAGGIEFAFCQELGLPDAAPARAGVCLAPFGKRLIAGLRREGRTLLKTNGGVMIGPPPVLSWTL